MLNLDDPLPLNTLRVLLEAKSINDSVMILASATTSSAHHADAAAVALLYASCGDVTIPRKKFKARQPAARRQISNKRRHSGSGRCAGIADDADGDSDR